MRLGFLTVLSMGCDTVYLGLDANVLEETNYQTAWHNIPDHNLEIYFYTLLLGDP